MTDRKNSFTRRIGFVGWQLCSETEADKRQKLIKIYHGVKSRTRFFNVDSSTVMEHAWDKLWCVDVGSVLGSTKGVSDRLFAT